MRWSKGDIGEHVDNTSNGDKFEKSYLVYLTDSLGEFIIGNDSYPIKSNMGFTFDYGVNHKVINTENNYRLMIGPINEYGSVVGAPSPTLISIVPYYSFIGSTVTLSYENLGSYILENVLFNDQITVITNVDPINETITCLVPPGTGTVPVKFTYTDGVTIYNSNPLNFTYIAAPIGNVCFLEKTPVSTDQGIINIEKINPLKNTINNKKIVAITKTITQDNYLICFEKHSLGINYPNKKTIISRKHKIFYNGKLTEAQNLLSLPGVKKVDYNGDLIKNYNMKSVNIIHVAGERCDSETMWWLRK
jgi:hypothetical protein